MTMDVAAGFEFVACLRDRGLAKLETMGMDMLGMRERADLAGLVDLKEQAALFFDDPWDREI